MIDFGLDDGDDGTYRRRLVCRDCTDRRCDRRRRWCSRRLDSRERRRRLERRRWPLSARRTAKVPDSSNNLIHCNSKSVNSHSILIQSIQIQIQIQSN